MPGKERNKVLRQRIIEDWAGGAHVRGNMSKKLFRGPDI
jgi:hypothetical protein